MDERADWSDEVRASLTKWGRWARGNHLLGGTKHVLARMIRQAAGELPGWDISVPHDMTVEIEAVEKAIGRFRLEAEQQEQKRKRYMKDAKRVLMRTYLGNDSIVEIAMDLNCSEKHVKALLWYAESAVGRYLGDVRNSLRVVK